MRIAVAMFALLVAGCSSDEAPATFSGPVLQRTGVTTTSVLARAYANPTAGIGVWSIDHSGPGTRIWYGQSSCPWAGSAARGASIAWR